MLACGDCRRNGNAVEHGAERAGRTTGMIRI
jgi:hypothetical protein